MYIVVGYHVLDDQCIAMRVANMTRISLTEGNIFYLTVELFGRPLVERARGRDRPFPCVSEVAVLGSSCLSCEVWSVEDFSDLARRSYLTLVVVRVGASVADVVLEVSFSDEFFQSHS